MVFADTDFWNRLDKAAPGLLNTGANILGANAARRENAGMIADAQGPLYRQAMRQAGAALADNGSEWLRNQRSLLAGPDAADEDALFRRLQATGMLGAASYNPGVEGVTPNGTAMNPQMAAFYAARNARNAKMASDAQDQGINRAAKLHGIAAGAQNTGMGAMNPATKTNARMNLLKGGASIAKDLGYGVKDVAGLFKGGADWLGNATGWWGGPEQLSADLWET
jgi:hypothetical protein